MTRWLVLAACASPAPPPHAIVQPEPPRQLVAIDPLVLDPVVVPPQTMYVISAPVLDALAPPAGAVLATDRKVAADADKLVRARAGDDAAIRKRLADPGDRDAKRADIDRFNRERLQATDQLVDLLAAHEPVLTADGAWLYAFAWAERSRDHFEAAYSMYLDNPVGPEPKLDFAEAIAKFETYALRFPDAHQAEVRIEIDQLRNAPLAVDPDVRLASARDLCDVARGGAYQELAYSLAANLFDDDIKSLADTDVHAYATALRWLVDNAGQPDSRAHAIVRLAELLYQQRDPGAADALCRLDGDTSELAATLAEYDHARLAGVLVGDPDTLARACDAHACPCRAPVVEALAGAYAGVSDWKSVRELLELAGREGFPDDAAWSCLRAQLDGKSEASCPAPKREPPDAARLRHLLMIGPARRCLEHQPGVHGELVASVTVGGDENTRDIRPMRSDLPPNVKLCMLAALRAQTWTGLADRELLVPLRIDAP